MTQREAAYKYIKRIIDDGAYSNLVLNSEGGFTRRLVLGCIERKLTLQYFARKFARKKPDSDTMALLFSGIYQIMYMDVPDSAACDETVKLAKKYLGTHRAGFVNAVLRSVCRNKDELLHEVENAPDDIKYSISPDICTLLRSFYADDADRIFRSYFDLKKLFLRVNTEKTTASDVAKLVGGRAISDRTVTDADSESVIRHIDDGIYFVQGSGSQYAVDMLDIHPGMTVADVCACPGGKTFAAAILTGTGGKVYSSDIHSGKLKLVRDGAQRLEINNIDIAECDARIPRDELIGKCDRVICDVPCSALGEIASKPDIRYKSVADLSGLYRTQREILAASSRLLKDGGMLAYSTCTLNKRENEDAVDCFLRENSGFSLISQRTFLPYENNTAEGFFAALIKKDTK